MTSLPTAPIPAARPPRVRPDLVLATQRRLARGYVIALSLIAALTIGAGWFLSALVERQSEDAMVINRAGAQRVLSERIAALLADLVHPRNRTSRLDAIEGIDDAVRRLETSHASLVSGPDAPARETSSLHFHYFAGPGALDRTMTDFIARMRTILAAARDNAGPSEEEVAALRAQALGFLPDALQMAVGLHEAASRGRVAYARSVHHTAIGFALGLLALEALFIFWPLSRQVGQLARTLSREASIDPLTGLMNRRAITTALGEALTRGTPVAVIVVDLDHFKEVNDAAGHAAGDALLRAVAARLIECVRPGDIVGRIGGDEFTVFLMGVGDVATARIVADRMRDSLHRPVIHGDRTLRLGATLGVAVAPLDADTPEVILRAADEALIRAKRESRGTIGHASRGDADRITRAAAIIGAFDASCTETGITGISAHLQPIISLRVDPEAGIEVLSFEALARWSHPTLGQISPGEFLPVIGPERTARLGAAVRDDALRILADLRARGLTGARVALNLSAGEVMRPDIALEIEAQVQAAGLSLDAIEIEITEEVLLDRVSDRTLEHLAALRGRGAKLMLDDFGTGTSGLSQLLRLPLDAVKLDKTFVQRLGVDDRAAEIVRATMSLARGLGLEVIAEGVETEQQAAHLRTLDCDAAQGFLFARPMARTALEAWLTTGPGAQRTGAVHRLARSA
ncbi:MAG: EAL domain-containing protein [Alphaproteobacteria bacterium]|nr:EAL domain-containing protein [Alphaproteobacteria bacterium]